MKLAQCAAFVSVVDSGSFTRAARALGLTQSAISHAIARLEAELGGPLMTRDRGGVALTELGRLVVADARALVRHGELMRRKARGDAAPPGDRLRFGVSQSFAARLLPALLSGLESAAPATPAAVPVIREGTDGQIASWLEGGTLDVGVLTLPKPRLHTVPLLADELLALIPAAHPLARRERIALTALSGTPLVLPVGGIEPMLRAGLLRVGASAAVAYRIRDINALLALAAEGLGVGVLPSLALPEATPGLAVRGFDPPLTRRLGLGVAAGARDDPAAARLIGIVQSLVSEGRWRTAALPGPVDQAPEAGTGRTLAALAAGADAADRPEVVGSAARRRRS